MFGRTKYSSSCCSDTVVLNCTGNVCDDNADIDNVPEGPVNISLEKIFSLSPQNNGISQPIVVVKSTVLPGETRESLLACTQPGQIWKIPIGPNGSPIGSPTLLLDISFEGSNPLVKKLGTPGFYIPNYDERGLLGIAFSKNFYTTGQFFLYYTPNEYLTDMYFPISTPTPCNPITIPGSPTPCDSTDPDMWDESKYSHCNVVEIWQYNNGNPIKDRRILTCKHPYFNHDSLDNLFYDTFLDKLVLFTGDGGYRDGPFNLSQIDDYFHGKFISIDVSPNAMSIWNTYDPVPIARFTELPSNVQQLLETLVKGVRNSSGIGTYPDNNGRAPMVKFCGQPGQDTVEAVFAFKCYKTQGRPRNFGWRAWEGNYPGCQNMCCGPDCGDKGDFTTNYTDFKNFTQYQESVDLNVIKETPYLQYFHQNSQENLSNGAILGVTIVGQQPYLGYIPKLRKNLIVTDWGTHGNPGATFPNSFPVDGGQAIVAAIDERLDSLHKSQKITINYNFFQEYTGSYSLQSGYTRPLFLGLGASLNHENLYILAYNNIGSAEQNGLAVIYKITAP